jgi:uncharacterized protein
MKFISRFYKKIPPIDEIRPLQAKIAAICIVSLFMLLTALGIFHVTGVKTEYTLRQFFPTYHPLLKQDQMVKDRFALGDGSPYLLVANIESQSDDWSNKAHLDAVKALTEKIKSMPQIKSVSDISTLQGAVQTEGELGIGSVVDYLTPRLFKRELNKNHIISPLFVSRDAHILTIFVTAGELSSSDTELVKNQLLAEAKQDLSFATVSIGGVPAIQSDVNEILNEEVLRFIVVAFFMSLIALAVIFKNGYPIVACTVAALVTNIMSVWGIMIFGFSFNILSSTIPILVTMTVISISIHSILRLIERLNSSAATLPYHVVIWRTFRELFRPNLLTALTTSVGFFTLTLSDAPIIKEFGLSVGIALLVTWVNTAVLLPAFLLIGKKPRLRLWMSAKARWAFYIMRFNKLVLLSVVGLSVFGAWKGQSLSWEAKLFDDLPKNHAVRRTTELVDRYLGGLVPLDIEVRLPGKGDGSQNPWSHEPMVKDLELLSKQISDRKGVGSVITMTDILRSSGLMSGPKKASASEVMFLLSMSSENPLRQFLSTDNLSTRVSVRLKDIPGARMWRLVQDIKSMARNQFPTATIRLAGTAAYVHDINNALSKDLLFGFWQAMLVIFILLVISYRSLTWAILACLPNLTPPALLLGALSLWHIPIKPGIAIILSISLGLAFNNTVYLLERMRDMMAKGHSYQKALIHTFWSESNPCFFASVVLIVGFAGFAVSYFKMNQLFGVFMVLSVVTGLLGDLVLLPALLQFIFDQGLELFNMKRVRGAILVLLLSFLVFGVLDSTTQAATTAPTKSAGTTDLTALGAAMQGLVATRDETGTITMVVTEPDGQAKTREINYSRLNTTKTNNHFTLMRMVTPKDMKDMAILSVIKNGDEEKWVYLPASKQTRKISTAEGNARVLDSELYSEDFDLDIVKTANSRISKRNPDGSVAVETTLAPDKGAYSKTICYVGSNNLLKNAEVFDKKGVQLKTIEFLNYAQVAPGKWRAMKIQIVNVQNKRKTDLALSNVKVNLKLKEADFSTRTLAEGF